MNRSRLVSQTLLVAVILGIVAVFAFVGLPYGQYSWTNAVAESPYQSGCTIEIPAGSVVGKFTSTAPFAATSDAEFSNSFKANEGQTAWVIGVNASKTQYKIVWACQYVWVGIDTLAPNPDRPWLGAALPTRIVE